MKPTLMCLCIAAALAATAHAEKKPAVAVLATGGTIAGVAQSEAQISYDPSKLSVDTLLASVPALANIAEVTGEQVAQVSSQDMDDATWLKLADRVNALLGDEAVDGVVITHGTDTMEESAFFLDLVTDSPKPVVFVGAVRPANALSPDGPVNLYNAVAVAGDEASRDRGVLLVMNDTSHSAREVTKTNTMDLDTFDSPNTGPVGEVHFGKVEFFEPPLPRPEPFDITGLEELPRVDIVYAHANMDGALIDAAVQAGAKGIVIAGVGNGNMSRAALAAVRRAVAQGIVFVRSNRTGSGETTRNHEINDDDLGTVAGHDLNPQKARVLLRVVLTVTDNPEEVQETFDEY